MPDPHDPAEVVRRSGDRFETIGDGLRTLHSFSYGAHYDPDDVGFGPLVALNEEHVAPGSGYDPHRHADVEIVTWVLEGALTHADTSGHGIAGVVRPGVVQRLGAGAGVEHSERNASDETPLVFVQMMLRPRFDPDDPEPADGVPVQATAPVPAGPGVHPTVRVDAEAELLVVRPDGRDLAVPAAPRVLVHVTRGALVVRADAPGADAVSLGPGDQLRSSRGASLRVGGEGEALVWRLDVAHVTTG